MRCAPGGSSRSSITFPARTRATRRAFGPVRGEAARAIEAYRSALALGERAELDLNLGRAYERLGREEDARAALDTIRAVVSELDVARATAQADLSHLAHTCEDAVNATLDEVLVEVDQLERDGQGARRVRA